MNFRDLAAVWAAKQSKVICRLFHHAGASLPGKVMLKISPRIISGLSKEMTVVMVTGTNGKTTTAGMIAAVLEKAGVRYAFNKSGANLIGGVASAFVDAVDLLGRRRCSLALLEVDEATLPNAVDFVSPDILVVTNFFRDQLDRYGDIYSVVEKVRSAVGKIPRAKLVLNADDSLCASLGAGVSNQTEFFGVEPQALPRDAEPAVSVATHCLFCQGEYCYSYKVMGHLGGFKCPRCGYKRPDAQIRCTQVRELNAMSSVVRIEDGSTACTATVAVPGLFNVYNLLAAAACCRQMGLPVEKAADALQKYESRFGRMEAIPAYDGKRILLILAKNPAGFNQILRYLSMEGKSIDVSFAINDKAQDGTDVSWLWDVDFERLGGLKNRLSHVYSSGLRAEDMALRLKYSEIPPDRIKILKDYRQLVEEGLTFTPAGGTFFIVATYTAMMEIRRRIKSRYGLKEIW